jgi:hypothetical protein
MATVQIEVSDEKAATYKMYAEARGLTVEQWFLQLAERSAAAPAADPRANEDDRPIWEIFADSMKDVPREALAALPKDGASQIDHYICGHPKR